MARLKHTFLFFVFLTLVFSANFSFAKTSDEIFDLFAQGATPDLSNPDHAELFELYIFMRFAAPNKVANWPDMMAKIQEAQENHDLTKYPHHENPLLAGRLPNVEITYEVTRYETLPRVEEIYNELKVLSENILQMDSPYWQERTGDITARVWEQAFKLTGEGYKNLQEWANNPSNRFLVLIGLAELLEIWIEMVDDDEDKEIFRGILYDVQALVGFVNPHLQSRYISGDGYNRAHTLFEMVSSEIEVVGDTYNLYPQTFEEYPDSASIDLLEIQNEIKGLLDTDKMKPVNGDMPQQSSSVLRQLSPLEGPFSGCLGRHCSTNRYPLNALEKHMHVFTKTGADGTSRGSISIGLGSGLIRDTGSQVSIAMIDDIQGFSPLEAAHVIEAVRLSLEKFGYLLGIPDDIGQGFEHYFTNDELTHRYINNEFEPYVESDQVVVDFVPLGEVQFGKPAYVRVYQKLPLRVLKPLGNDPRVRFNVHKTTARPTLGKVSLAEVRESTFRLRWGNAQQQVRYIQISKLAVSNKNTHLMEANTADGMGEIIAELYQPGSAKVRRAVVDFLLEHAPDKLIEIAPDVSRPDPRDGEFITTLQNLLQDFRTNLQAMTWIIQNRSWFASHFLRGRRWIASIIRTKNLTTDDRQALRYWFVLGTDILDHNLSDNDLQRLFDHLSFPPGTGRPKTTEDLIHLCMLESPEVFSENGRLRYIERDDSFQIASSPVRYFYLIGGESGARVVSDFFHGYMIPVTGVPVDDQNFISRRENVLEAVLPLLWEQSQKGQWSYHQQVIFLTSLLVNFVPSPYSEHMMSWFLALPQTEQVKIYETSMQIRETQAAILFFLLKLREVPYEAREFHYGWIASQRQEWNLFVHSERAIAGDRNSIRFISNALRNAPEVQSHFGLSINEAIFIAAARVLPYITNPITQTEWILFIAHRLIQLSTNTYQGMETPSMDLTIQFFFEAVEYGYWTDRRNQHRERVEELQQNIKKQIKLQVSRLLQLQKLSGCGRSILGFFVGR